MKLSVSNLAWPIDETDWCLDQLVNHGIKGVEIAPLKVFDSWESISVEGIAKVRKKYNDLGLEISSFQAITFGASDLALLNDKAKVDNFLRHMEKVAWLLSELGGENAVFGSPGLRKDANYDENELINLFKSIDLIFAKYKVNFVWETVPNYYGCNLLNNIQDTDTFFNRIELNNVGRHFDTGCQHLSGDLEDINRCIDFIGNSKHLHISEVDLNNFSNPAKYNKDTAEVIKKHYHGEWCVLEMGDKAYSRESFISSIENFKCLFDK